MSTACSSGRESAPSLPERDQSRLTSAATRHYILATAGHVDHGKSALVKALTGTDPDRLPEEKARGITIELGFAHLQLAAAVAPFTTFDIGIIDVPGHEDFVKQMVAGAGAIDLALLVVAADDGWMPQTEEHLQILTYLGVTRAIVVLTKCDLLAPGEEETKLAAVREKLLESPFAEAPIIPVSVVSGQGLERLREALTHSLAEAPPPRDIGKPRLPIDRVFTLPGVGTVVTGTLRGGVLSKGQDVVIQPAGIATRIRALQSHNQELASAGPGMRTALNLTAEHLDGTFPGEPTLRRGQVVTLPGLGACHDRCEVLLERSPRVVGGSQTAGRPLKSGTRIRFHAGTGNTPGRIFLSERNALGPGEYCCAQIRFESPVYLFLGDRFVIRDWAEQMTLAGGVLLEPTPMRKRVFHPDQHPLSPARLSPHLDGNRNEPAQRSPLSSSGGEGRGEEASFTIGSNITHTRALCSPAPSPPIADVRPVVERHLQQRPMVWRQGLLAQSNFSEGEIAAALNQLSAAGKLVLQGDLAIERGEWDALQEKARTLVNAFHQSHPEQPGMPLAQLRSTLAGQLDISESFDVLQTALLRAGFEQVGPVLRRANYRPALPPQLQSAGNRIRSTLALKALEPPSRKELAPDRPAQEALRFLLQTGEAVELSSEIVLLSSQLARATELIRNFLRQHSSATVSELRQVIGASRRIAVPLLEKLDRDGVTRRNNDKRELRS